VGAALTTRSKGQDRGRGIRYPTPKTGPHRNGCNYAARYYDDPHEDGEEPNWPRQNPPRRAGAPPPGTTPRCTRVSDAGNGCLRLGPERAAPATFCHIPSSSRTSSARFLGASRVVGADGPSNRGQVPRARVRLVNSATSRWPGGRFHKQTAPGSAGGSGRWRPEHFRQGMFLASDTQMFAKFSRPAFETKSRVVGEVRVGEIGLRRGPEVFSSRPRLGKVFQGTRVQQRTCTLRQRLGNPAAFGPRPTFFPSTQEISFAMGPFRTSASCGSTSS